MMVEATEIASRLKEINENSGFFEAWYDEIFAAVMGRYPDSRVLYRAEEGRRLMERLADLIEQAPVTSIVTPSEISVIVSSLRTARPHHRSSTELFALVFEIVMRGRPDMELSRGRREGLRLARRLALLLSGSDKRLERPGA